MHDGDKPYTRWSEPATKGDVVTALSVAHAAIVDAYVTLSRLTRGDETGVKESLDSLYKSSVRVDAVIDDIGGKEGPDE